MKQPGRALLALMLLLPLVASPAAAEVLVGRIFLGPGLSLYLEKDEGLFVEMLRALSLVGSEVPVINLTALEISRDHLFLGTDHKVYLRDEDDHEVHKVGTWKTPRCILLDPDVVLRVNRTTSQIFEGETRDGLRVSLDSGPARVAYQVRPTDLEYWLDHLTEIFLPGGMSRSEEADAGLIVNALMGAFPTDPTPTAQQGENLKKLRSWVTSHRFENLSGVMVVLDKVRTRLRGEQLQGRDELTRNERRGLEEMARFYDSIRDMIRARGATD